MVRIAAGIVYYSKLERVTTNKTKIENPPIGRSDWRNQSVTDFKWVSVHFSFFSHGIHIRNGTKTSSFR